MKFSSYQKQIWIKANRIGEFSMRWMIMGMCNEWIYMWLFTNLNFGISWVIVSVVKATTLHAEGHLLHSCILQHITIGMNIYPDLFSSRAGEDLVSQCSTQTINLFWYNKYYDPNINTLLERREVGQSEWWQVNGIFQVVILASLWGLFLLLWY